MSDIDPTIAALMRQNGIRHPALGNVQATRQPRRNGLWAQTVEAASRAWHRTVADMGGHLGMEESTKARLRHAPGTIAALQYPSVELADLAVKGYHGLGAAFEAAVAGLNKLSDESGLSNVRPGGRPFRLGEALGAAVEYPGNPAAALEGTAIRLAAPKPVKLRVAQSVRDAELTAQAVAAKAAEEAAPAAKASVVKVATRAPAAAKVEPKIADGELLTADEMAGDPHRARQLLDERLGTLSEEQATAILDRVTKAMESGDVVDEPFFRSFLHVDTKAVADDPRKLYQTLDIFDDAFEGLAEKAGAGRMTAEQFAADFEKLRGRDFRLEDLAHNAERSRALILDARIGTHAAVKAGHAFLRAREALLPKIVAGEVGAREQLVEELVHAAKVYAVGKAPLSNAGRAMRFSQEKLALGLSKADDVIDTVDPKLVEARVREAVDRMDNDDLSDLLGKLGTTDDLDRLEAILMDADAAANYGKWRRLREFVSKSLRSNALSPATGLYNAASMVIHDFFRADLSRTWAARSLERAGRLDEATALRLERAAGRAVYWEAHKRGLKAMIDRIKWETFTEVEKIAKVGWGSGKVAQTAKQRRAQMLAEGYRAPELREFENRPGLGLTSKEVAEFNARQQTLADDGSALARILAFDERAEAVGRNLVDALAGASMKAFTGSLDDWGQAFVRTKELHVQSTRFAVKEGLQQGLKGAELAEYVQERAKQLAEMPNGDVMEATEMAVFLRENASEEARFLARRDELLDNEAMEVLFMDEPQTQIGRWSAGGLSWLDRLGVVFPYVKTPVRLLERGLIDYTPMAKITEKNRAILQAGGPEADLLRARMHLGATAIALGATLGAAGVFVVTNGGPDNTAGLAAGPPNRLQVGDFYVELNRLDPFVTTLAIGGFLGQAAKEGFMDATTYEVNEGMKTATSMAVQGLQDGMLSKTYLTGLRDLIDATGASDENRAEAAIIKLLSNAGVRMIPLAGTSRQLNDTARDTVPETITFVDQMIRAIPGAGIFLPVKRDLLGNPVKSREFGIWAGRSDQLGGGDEPVDEVTAQLRDLHIDVKAIRRMDPTGFQLTAEQLAQLRYIRGKEATNAYGQTLAEALKELFADEEFQLAGTKAAKQMLVAARVAEFNGPAREILEERDPAFKANREGWRAFKDYLEKDLLSKPEAEQRATEDNLAMGLMAPEF